MNSDIIYILEWWLLFFVLGVVSIPTAWVIFKRFIDLGYGLAKTIGLLIITYLIFLGGIFHLVPLNLGWHLIIFGVYLFLNTLIFLKKKKEIVSTIHENFKVLLAQEALFSSGYLFWALVRGYQPDIRGLEKFMDYGFINSILKAKFLPPPDMWLSGTTINYYWFGHLWVAVATKLSNIPPAITFNLMLATILGLTLTATFSISATLIKNLNLKIGKKAAYTAGVISALLLVFAGSFHTPIYVLKDGAKNYWYPDATRFIGYHPETNDKTIHEFPQYSFIVSDLHAHLINLPIALLSLALLLAVVLKISEGKNLDTFDFSKRLIPLGFTLGVTFMTNAWDFGNYLLAAGVCLGFFYLINRGMRLGSLLAIATSLGIVLLIGLLTALPFIFNFESIAQGVAFVKSHTPLWQLGVLWGFPAVLTVIYLSFLFRTHEELKTSDVYIFSLLATSWILIVLPEIIYVKDIYIASHHRANTMFKLTYQAFVMFYLSSGYITVRTLTLLRKASTKILACLFYALIFSSILSYSYFATNSYYGGLKSYKGLSGESWLKDFYPSEYRTVLWLRKNVPNQPMILEAPGDSYTDYNVISAYTGLPTISGWFVHEWLWRGTPEAPQKRVSDISEIYTSKDVKATKELLQKYQVAYVIISTFEREKYPNLYEQKFKMIGKLVFSSGATTIYQILN